jgi:hypothetical protein
MWMELRSPLAPDQNSVLVKVGDNVGVDTNGALGHRPVLQPAPALRCAQRMGPGLDAPTGTSTFAGIRFQDLTTVAGCQCRRTLVSIISNRIIIGKRVACSTEIGGGVSRLNVGTIEEDGRTTAKSSPPPLLRNDPMLKTVWKACFSRFQSTILNSLTASGYSNTLSMV